MNRCTTSLELLAAHGTKRPDRSSPISHSVALPSVIERMTRMCSAVMSSMSTFSYLVAKRFGR
jgi:hypothetical protein